MSWGSPCTVTVSLSLSLSFLYVCVCLSLSLPLPLLPVCMCLSIYPSPGILDITTPGTIRRHANLGVPDNALAPPFPHHSPPRTSPLPPFTVEVKAFYLSYVQSNTGPVPLSHTPFLRPPPHPHPTTSWWISKEVFVIPGCPQPWLCIGCYCVFLFVVVCFRSCTYDGLTDVFLHPVFRRCACEIWNVSSGFWGFYFVTTHFVYICVSVALSSGNTCFLFLFLFIYCIYSGASISSRCVVVRLHVY